MPLELYQRGSIYWFRGYIEQLPNSRYYRQSTGKTSEGGARAVVNHFERRELERYYGQETKSLTFSEAVMEYPATPEMAKYLLPLVAEIGDMETVKITPKMVKNLGAKLQPNNSCDTWQKQIITPIRAVINNAHELGLCPPIKIKSYSEKERLTQDKRRRKQSRKEKTAGNWPWHNAFRAHAPQHLAALDLFLFETAARISQALAITFQDLDVERMRVWMPEAKGVKAQWVDLTPELTAELAMLKPRYTKRKNGKRELNNQLFGYLRRDSVYKTWKRVCRDAEIEVIMPHAAGRHGFATEMLVRQGLDPITVAKGGRWADTTMLLKTYAHPEDTSDKIQEALRTGRVQHESKETVISLKKQGNS